MMYLIFARSIVLTSTFSFVAPSILLGVLLVSFSLLGAIPHLGTVSQAINVSLCSFLATFGQGNVGQGILAIGLTCALVGALFDTYAFCHRQKRA